MGPIVSRVLGTRTLGGPGENYTLCDKGGSVTLVGGRTCSLATDARRAFPSVGSGDRDGRTPGSDRVLDSSGSPGGALDETGLPSVPGVTVRSERRKGSGFSLG